MRTIKLKPQAEDLAERKLRLRLPGRLAADLDAYRAFYANAHGREIEMAALIEAILEQFLATDRRFQQARVRERTSTSLTASGLGE
jgi:hypothetical protein